MKRLLLKMFTAVLTGLLLGCSTKSADEDMRILNLSGSASGQQVQDITVDDLVGKWNMYTMTSSESVDFDKNGTYTYDLLEETDCFDPMFFIFDNEGNLTTEQARLFFDAASGKFSCQTTGSYPAVYSVSGDQLKVVFSVDGIEYTETKTISRYTEGGIEFLKITLTKAETDTAVYVANDPGNTVVSEIQKIDLVYEKVK